MFVFKRNILAITRYTETLCRNLGTLNKKYMLQKPASGLTKHPLHTTTPFKALNNPQENSEQNTPQEESASSYDAITKGNKELEHKLKVIMLEVDVLRQEGHLVPPQDYFTSDMWEVLLNLPSRTARRKQLEFLFKNAKKKESRLIKKLENQKSLEEHKSTRDVSRKCLPIEEHALQYGLIANNIFLRVHDTTMNHFYNSRLVQAMQFGQKIVIDCGYDQNMTKRENFNCAKQIMLLFAENRFSNDPFDIHYTNINKKSDLATKLHKYIPTMYDLEFPMNTHEKSYLDLFQKENLVYLTPHCREEMDSYDPNAVYIIGGIVDKVNSEPLSLAKAKREGIKMKKFPIDRYLQWSAGSGKSLTLNQCVAILLDIKETGDWNHALRHVPRRKLYDARNNNQSFSSSLAREDSRTNSKSNWKPKNSNYRKPSYLND